MYDWTEIDEEDKLVIIRSDRDDNISIQLSETNLKDVDITALIDCRAQGQFVDESAIGTGKRRV